MFKNLLSKFHLWKEQRKYKRAKELSAKKFFIKLKMISYYNDINKMHNVVDIPAHIKADRIMNEVLRKPSDIDRLYKKALEYQGGLL